VFVTNGGYNGVQQVLVGNNQDSDYGSSDNKPPLSLNFDVNAPKKINLSKTLLASGHFGGHLDLGAANRKKQTKQANE
jgi:hypothetical protein